MRKTVEERHRNFQEVGVQTGKRNREMDLKLRFLNDISGFHGIKFRNVLRTLNTCGLYT